MAVKWLRVHALCSENVFYVKKQLQILVANTATCGNHPDPSDQSRLLSGQESVVEPLKYVRS